jgi:hypothetical protein
MDPDRSSIRILLFLSLTFKMSTENKVLFYFSDYYFLKVHLHHFSKIKSKKNSQNSRNQGFSYYFGMMIERSGSIPLWIRIREAQKHVNPDPTVMLNNKKAATVPG